MTDDAIAALPAAEQRAQLPTGPALHLPSGAVFDEVIAAVDHAALVALTPSETLTDDEMLARAVVENLGQEVLINMDLSPAEIFERGFKAGLAAAEAKRGGA